MNQKLENAMIRVIRRVVERAEISHSWGSEYGRCNAAIVKGVWYEYNDFDVVVEGKITRPRHPWRSFTRYRFDREDGALAF